MRHSIVILAAALPLAGCLVDNRICEQGSWPTAGEPADGETDNVSTGARMERVAEVLPTTHSAIDLLFVVDDSHSMTDEQEQLGRWSSELFNVLGPTGELPDLHIAVLSSSLWLPTIVGCERGDDGVFHVGAADLGADRFLRDIAGADGERIRNYEGTLAETFASMARVGPFGCGFEQPLAATRLALSGEIVENAGFLRDDALLVVVFVSDEDDCSMSDASLVTSDRGGDQCSSLGSLSSFRCFEFGVRCDDGKGARVRGSREACHPDESSPYIAPVAPYAEFLKQLKDQPGKVIVAGVYGKPSSVTVGDDPRWQFQGSPRLDTVCDSEHGSATPAIRLNSLLSHFPARAAQSSICDPTLAWAMRNTALVTRRVAERSGCLAGAVADTDLDVDGVQPRCAVEASLVEGATSGVVVPPCGAADDGERCFTVEADASACAESPTQLAVRLRGEPLAGETLTVDCEVLE